MAINIGIVMDPLTTVHPDKDTTFALSLEALRRGYRIWYILQENLFMKDENPWCKAQEVQFQRNEPIYRLVGLEQKMPLDEFDVVLMRKDPPFDMDFFYATHLLSFCKKALVLNRPSSLREAPEKIYSLKFPGIFPPSLISSKAADIESFMRDCGGEIILKPLDGCGGKGIVYLNEEDRNFHSIVEMSTDEGKQLVIAQKYLKEVREGDKRIICVDGTARGAIWRIPQANEHRANMHVGGRVEYSELTERDHWLVDQITDNLREDGLYFTGLDVIGEYITEINVTSPTGIQEIYNLGGVDIAKMFWDELPGK